LVQFIKQPPTLPPHVVPPENPIGIVIGYESFLTSNSKEHAAYLEIVRVRWNSPKWNGTSGASSEHPSDLKVIQRISIEDPNF
jgi:hypothetical protein